jgi:hypothetical protein
VRLPGLSAELSQGLFGLAWFQVKVYVLLFVMMWLRWTLNRLRVDQLMDFAWKVLLPIAFANLIVTGLVLMLGRRVLFYVGGILLAAVILALAVRRGPSASRGAAATGKAG